MHTNKIILPDKGKPVDVKKKAIKKDQTLILPEGEHNTTTILEKEIKMNRATNKTSIAFGVSDERGAEILKKLISVAKIYPSYSIIAEVMLNCSDRFTQMERLFGLFLLGKTKGMATIMKTTNIQVKFNAYKMNLEQKLLSILSKRVVVEDPLLNKLLGKG